MKTTLLLISFLVTSVFSFSQDAFKHIWGNPSENITCIDLAPSGGTYTVGTTAGLKIFSGNNTYIFDKENADFGTNVINDVMWFNGSLWIATDSGLFYTQGPDYKTVTRYHIGNSSMTSNHITAMTNLYFFSEPTVACGTNGFGAMSLMGSGGWQPGEDFGSNDANTINHANIILGTYILFATNAGLYIGEVWGPWEYLNTSNSAMPSNKVNYVDVDPNKQLWLCTDAGLVLYDGLDLYLYNKANANLPDLTINAAAYLNDSIMLIGTADKGVFRFNSKLGKSTKHLHSDNSNLLQGTINDMRTDYNGNVWIATTNGLWLYNENGFSTGIDNINDVSNISIYPNPASSGIIMVSFNSHLNSQISIINAHGQAVISKEYLNKDNVTLDISSLPSGIYFITIKVDGGVTTKKIIIE